MVGWFALDGLWTTHQPPCSEHGGCREPAHLNWLSWWPRALSTTVVLPSGGCEKGLRRRKTPASRGLGASGDTRSGEISVETLHRVQTDTSPDALQKAVCFSDDHTLLATGGVDGFLRVWEVRGPRNVRRALLGQTEERSNSSGILFHTGPTLRLPWEAMRAGSKCNPSPPLQTSWLVVMDWPVCRGPSAVREAVLSPPKRLPTSLYH